MDFYGFSYSNMGVEDSENFSAQNSSLQELEKILNWVISENPPEAPRVTPATKTVVDLLIEDKKNYFQQIHSSIMDTKKSFLTMLQKINNDIEEMTKEIVLRTEIRKKMLQAQLLEVKRNRTSRWDRQMLICEQVLQDLARFGSSANFRDVSALDVMLGSHVTKELDFVDSGSLSLDSRSYPEILETIDRLGQMNIGSYLSTEPLSCTVPKFVFGSTGTDAGQFCRPWGVCTDETGRILVCDRSNHRIQIFSESGQFLIKFGKEGSKPGEFNRPSGLTVDVKCRIVVADKDNHRIQVFTYSGHHLLSFGTQGTKPGQFMYPWDVAVNNSCEIAVSDSKNHRIQLFSEEGVFLKMFDARAAGVAGFRAGLRFLDSPRGLAFRPDGSLLVTDFNNHRVLLLNKQFTGVTVFGAEGQGVGHFFRPQGITCDSTGRFAVADCKNYRIQVFDVNGKFEKAFGSQGVAPGQFDCPQGIAFHPNRNIIVVDFNNNRVQVF